MTEDMWSHIVEFNNQAMEEQRSHMEEDHELPLNRTESLDFPAQVIYAHTRLHKEGQ